MCPVCRAQGAEVGVLCIDCRDELSMSIRIAPEQIQPVGNSPVDAVLIDVWGRPHRLSTWSQVGRHIDGDGIRILEPSISRNHAQLAFDGAGWSLRDLGSANGSYADDQLAEPVLDVVDRTPVRFGQVAFYFLADGRSLAHVPRPVVATTAIPRIVELAPPPADDEFREEPTDPGLPSVLVRLHQPTGGGGGLLQIDRTQLQLTTPQFEMIELMVQRMEGESHQPPLLRGFVRSAELIRRLSWDTHRPNDNHVKQLVRRTRRSLIRSGVGDLIESRHSFGYRLRATPRTQ